MALTEAEQNRLIIENKRLVYYIANKIAAQKGIGLHHVPGGKPGEQGQGSISSEDLEAEGMLGLLQATRKFDTERRVKGQRVKFSSFAWPRGEGAMREFIDRWQVFKQLEEDDDEDACRTEWMDVESEEADGENEEDERLSYKWHERQTHKWQAWRMLFPEIWTGPEAVSKAPAGGPLKGSDYKRRQEVASR